VEPPSESPRSCEDRPAYRSKTRRCGTVAKTKSSAFNGYKRNLAIDLDTYLVLAVACCRQLSRKDARHHPSSGHSGTRAPRFGALYIDAVQSTHHRGGNSARRGLVVCRPDCEERETLRQGAFTINMRNRHKHVPGWGTERFVLDHREFTAESCRACPPHEMPPKRWLRRGRQVADRAQNEPPPAQNPEDAPPRSGRGKLRERVPSNTAHTPAADQGRRARIPRSA